MGLPPTSRLQFLDDTGAEAAAPREWRRSLIRLEISVDDLARATLLRNGQPLPLVAKQTAAGLCAYAEWPLSGTGRYRLHLDLDDYQETREVTVIPEKISQDAYANLIDELQTRLPASIAINLQRLGAFAGLQLRPPGETTLEQEFFRLRKAVVGGEARPGLAVLLPAIGRDPHRILRKSEHWVERHQARRIEPVGLIAAYRQASNIDPDTQLPRQVPNVRVEQTADVFENRLVKSYHDQVDLRLRRISAAFQARNLLVSLAEAEELQRSLRRARQAAEFLDDVSQPHQLTTRPTMVLLKRPNYRTLFENYLEFRRTAFVELDEPRLETPLESLPDLYEAWGTLHVIDVLLEVASRTGYQVSPPRLVSHSDGGLYLKVLPDGLPAVELEHKPSGTRACLTPQRSYYRASRPMRSISFGQTPDVTIEVLRPGESPVLYLFDPKYKLDSEADAEAGDGKPKKVDIDKMHAYRDAIRGPSDERVVRYAAILYPGPAIQYGDRIEALPARPLEAEHFDRELERVLEGALAV